MRLRTKTSILMATTVAVALAIIGVLYLQFLEESIRNSIDQGMVAVSQTVAGAVETYLTEGLADASAVAAIFTPTDIETRNVAAIEQGLKTMAGIYPKFENGFFLLDADGILWADYPAVAETRGRSFAHRQYFQQTMAHDKGIVGVPYRSARTGKPVVTFTAILRDDKGQVQGMLGCSAALTSPNALGEIRRTHIGSEGYVCIFDLSGTMILHPRDEWILDYSIAPGTDPLVDAAIGGFEGVGRTVNPAGVAMLASMKRIAGTDWVLSAQQPAAEAFAPLDSARRRVFLGIVLAAALAAGFGVVAVRRITRPLHVLQTAALEIGRPGVENRLKTITSKDEIGDLARTVETISGQLHLTLASLHESSVLWQRTFDAVADPVFILDTGLRIQRINQAAADWLGVAADEAIGKSGADLIYQSQQPPDNCPHTQTMRSGRMARVAMENLRPGKIHELTATALTDDHERISGSVLILRDTTAQKKAEMALRESEESYRDIVENSLDSIFSVDLRGRILACNRATCEALGCLRQQMVGTSYKQWMDGAMAEKVKAVFNGVFTSSRPHHDVRYLARRLDGQLVSFRGNVRLLVKNAKPMGFQVMIRDVTDQQRIEAQLQRVEKLEAIGTLAGGIAHDFNNILAAIMGYLNLARLDPQKRDDVVRYLSAAENAVSRAAGLTRQLLTFAKGGEPVKETIAIASLVEETALLTLGKAGACRHEIAASSDIKPVEADRGQIVQVVTDLLINARQAMADSGVIRITIANRHVNAKGEVGSLEPGDYVEVSVHDQGPGIAESIRERIFDPFFSTKKGGSGLGLATAHSIITRHGGHIELRSTDSGGTVFSFFLPAAHDRVEVHVQNGPALHAGSGRVLVMDDEEPIRDLLGDILGRAGYSVDQAQNGEEALAHVQRLAQQGQGYRLVIFDLTIPGGMGGLEAFGLIRKIDTAVKGIVTSGYSHDPVISDPAAYGFAGALQKPFKIGELTAMVRQLAA